MDVKPLARCEAKRKEWAKHCQSDTMVQDHEDMPWRNGELKTLDGDMPRLLEKELQMAAKSCKAKTGVGCDGFHPMVPLDSTTIALVLTMIRWREIPGAPEVA